MAVALMDLRLVIFSTGRLRQLVQTAPDGVAALIWTCAVAPSDRAETRAGERQVPHLTLVPDAAA